MADAVDVRGPAGGGDGVRDRPARAHVVEDLGAGLLGEDALREQRCEEVAVDELAGLVDEEAAVGVAVPGDAEVGALGADAVDDELAVLGQQRVRLVVGEVAVRLPVGRDEVEIQAVEQRADHRPRHPVAAVDDDLQRANLIRLDQGEGALLEVGIDVDLLDGAAAGRLRQAVFDQVAERRSRCRRRARAPPRGRA